MNKKPVFTVIVPTYNREYILKRAVDSILAQTFGDFELIIVDDGSVDNTKQLVDQYNDDRIIYIYKENGGLNSARNKALENANGDYIAFCDSDDKWLPEKLEKHMDKYREDKEIKVVYDLTGVIEIKDGGLEEIVLARDDTIEGWCYEAVLAQGYLTSPTFLSCKKECFDIVGKMPMDLTNCEDDDFCFQLCRHFKVGLVKEILGVYYCDASDRITSKKKMCADDFLKFQEKWSDEIKKVCGNHVLKRRYFQAAYNYLEIDEIEMAKDIYNKACQLGNISFRETKNQIKEKLGDKEGIIIYGIGEWGKKTYNLLRLFDYRKIIFTVTDKLPNIERFYTMPVRGIATLSRYVSDPLIIASLKYYDEMKLIAEKLGFEHIFSCEDILNLVFEDTI